MSVKRATILVFLPLLFFAMLGQVAHHPSLQSVDLNQLLLFFAVASFLKDDILPIQPSEHCPTEPPIILPLSLEHFLLAVCKISVTTIQDCWNIFKNVLWPGEVHSGSSHGISSILCAPLSLFEGQGLLFSFGELGSSGNLSSP
ncbi:hypothetical protein JVU11DRAFT_12385 [Chiua virens]|nr:hypothetical protein JVU11DRAFT_12385 [Chiua virens]